MNLAHGNSIQPTNTMTDHGNDEKPCNEGEDISVQVTENLDEVILRDPIKKAAFQEEMGVDDQSSMSTGKYSHPTSSGKSMSGWTITVTLSLAGNYDSCYLPEHFWLIYPFQNFTPF